jgi:hypothetical protein
MPYKPNFTDIRSTLIYNPAIIRTVGASVGNTAGSWRYLTSGSAVKQNSLSLIDGATIRNTGPNTAVLSVEGLSSGVFISGATADGFALVSNESLDMRVTDLSNIIFKSTSTTAVGVTLSYIAT